MPREVWGYTQNKDNTVTQTPKLDFTPRILPLSVSRTDPAKYNAPSNTLLASSSQGIGKKGGLISSNPKGITYTEPTATKNLNERLKKAREDNNKGGKKDNSGGIPCGGRCNNATQNCINGRCVDKAGQDTGCKTDTECGTGKKCVNGECKDATVTGADKCPDGTEGVMHKGVCHTRCEDTHGEEYTGTYPNCTLKSQGGGGGGGEVSGDDAIVKGGQLPDLVSITGEMDIRNMLSNVLNKNNPLFKQARTRALQAMAARGIVNSSMAEEAVMSAVMNVAVPIAQQASADLQKAMYANQNASNEFKLALNNAFASEMLARVNNASAFNLGQMKEGMTNWREYMKALTGAKDITGETAMTRYLDQISGAWKARA